MRAGRIVALVLGCIIGLIGLAVVAAGIVGIVAATVARDADGYLRTDEANLTTTSAAIVSENLDLGGTVDASWLTDRGDFATVSLDVRPAGAGKEVFVGIGPTAEVERYLGSVGRVQLVDFESTTDITYEALDGTPTASPPAAQQFWVAQVTAAGPGELVWEVEGGDWSVVLMNADGSAGVDLGVRAGIKLDWLLPVAIVVLVVGFLMLVGGTLLAVFAVRGSQRDAREAHVGGPPSGSIPPPPPPSTTAESDPPVHVPSDPPPPPPPPGRPEP